MTAKRNLWSDLALVGVAAFAIALTAWTVLRGMDGGTSNADVNPTTSPPSADSTPTTAVTAESGSDTTNSTISASGTVRAESQIMFDGPVSAMTLSVPAVGADWLPGDFNPRITNLRVSAEGVAVPGLSNQLLPGSRLVVNLPPGTTSASVTYDATGVVIRSRPSTSTRALVLVDPVSVDGADLSTTVQVNGAKILNLGCSGPDLPATACGVRTPTGWEVMHPAGAGAVDVVAQLNLPRAQ